MGFYRGEILLPARAITSKINLKKKTTNFSIKGRQFVSDPNFLVLSSVCVDSKKEPNLLGLLFFFLPLSIFGRFQSLWTFFFFLVNGNAFPSFFSIYLEIERCWLVGWPMNWLKKQKKKKNKKTNIFLRWMIFIYRFLWTVSIFSNGPIPVRRLFPFHFAKK